MSSENERVCCGLGCLKVAFHVFQVVFLITGIAICALGTIHFLRSYHFINILDSSIYMTIVYLFLSTGCLVILVFLIGYCAVPKHRTKLLFCYILFLVVIFLTEALVGVLSYIYHENLDEEMHLNYNLTILDAYKYDDSKTDSIDYVQRELKCCGANDFEDWKYSRWLHNNTIMNKVPDSCCKTISLNCGFRDHPSNIFFEGCVENITSNVKYNLWLICAVSLGLSLVQVFGIVIGVILFLKVESDKYNGTDSPNGHETLLSEAFH